MGSICFLSGRIFSPNWPEKSARSWQHCGSLQQPVATRLCECVHIQHQLIKPFCSLENVSSCKKKKREEECVENQGEKHIFIFTGRILLLCCLAGSVCKIDITLYIISFLEKYCKLSSPGPLLCSPAPAHSLVCDVEKYLIRIVLLSFSCVRRDRLSQPMEETYKKCTYRQYTGQLFYLRLLFICVYCNVFTSLHKPFVDAN